MLIVSWEHIEFSNWLIELAKEVVLESNRRIILNLCGLIYVVNGLILKSCLQRAVILYKREALKHCHALLCAGLSTLLRQIEVHFAHSLLSECLQLWNMVCRNCRELCICTCQIICKLFE